jgi:phosphoserine phosphatase
MTPHTPEPVWLFDLDGTVLTSNSFPLWVKFMLAGKAPAPLGARIAAAVSTAILLAKRKAFGAPHDVFKAGLQRAWARYGAASAAAADALGARLERDVRANMADALAIARTRDDAWLATAAAGEYAEPFARRLGFRRVLATPVGRASEGSYVGPRKRDAALAALDAAGWGARPIVFFTDHEEDLPLMQASDRVIWFGPGDQAEAIARQLKPGAQLVPALGLDSRAVAAAASAPLPVGHDTRAAAPAA